MSTDQAAAPDGSDQPAPGAKGDRPLRGFVKTASGCLAAILVSGVLSTGVAWSHHSFAMFDRRPDKETALTGALKELEFVNPHSWLRIYAVDGPSKGTLWSFEMTSVSQLKTYGWSVDTVKPGDLVTVSYYPLRFGSNGGELVSVKLADGRVLKGLTEGDRGFPTSR